MNSSEERHTRDLAQQLAEPKATIAALLSGQIDAVVDASNGTTVLLANAQAALRESEARFREQAALLDIAHDAIYVRDLDGQITYWNKGAEQAAGMDAYLSKPIDPNALFDAVDRQLVASAADGERTPTVPRDSAELQSAALASTENDRRP
jgi:PAS domain-containing protein